MKLSINHLPDDTVHISRFGGVDTGVMELDAVSQLYPVLHCSWLVWMIWPDRMMVLLPSVANLTAFLSNADLTTLTRDNVYTQCLPSRSCLMSWWKLHSFLGKRPINFTLFQDSTLLMHLKVGLTQGRTASVNQNHHWAKLLSQDDWEPYKSASCCRCSAWI
jgi:hypothetical protein